MADGIHRAVAERQANPVLMVESVAEIVRAVREAGPKYVVLLGKHEPLEPTSRLVEAKVDGKPLHEHYGKNEVLFIRLPESHTPYGFRKRHAEFLKGLAGEIERGEAHITPNPVVDRAFAKAVRDSLAGNRTGLPELFAENLLAGGMSRERIYLEVNTARDVVHNIAIAQGIVPPTEQMVCDAVGKAVGRKIDFIALHYDTGFMSKVDEFTTGRRYGADKTFVTDDYSYMPLEFGSGGIAKMDAALGAEEKNAIEMSSGWEKAPERLFPECRSTTEDNEIAISSQVGSQDFYLKRVGEIDPGKLEGDAAALKGVIDQLIRKG